MPVIDLRGPDGNAFALIGIMRNIDPRITPSDFDSYNQVLSKFMEVAGHQYVLINIPSSYKDNPQHGF